MRRSSIVFVVFVVIIAALIGASRFVQSQPAQTLGVAADPSIQAWVSAQAERFNATNPIVNNATTRIQIEVISVGDVEVWQGRTNWTSQNHPVGWIPASSASLDYLPPNLPLRMLSPSLAQSPLVWGGFASRVQVLTTNSTPLDWQSIYTAAQAGTWSALGQPSAWGNVNIAIISPSTSMAGYGALLSAIAHYQQSPQIDRNQLGLLDFSAWFSPLRDALTAQRPSAQPALEMANRGAGWAALALLPEYDWLMNYEALMRQEPLLFAYPSFSFSLDYPLALWEDNLTSATQRQGLQAFADFMMRPEAQSALADYSLRRADGTYPAQAPRFVLAQTAGILAALPTSSAVQAPDRSGAEQIVRLLN